MVLRGGFHFLSNYRYPPLSLSGFLGLSDSHAPFAPAVRSFVHSGRCTEFDTKIVVYIEGMPCQYVPKNQWTDKTPPVRQFFPPKILCNQMISRLFQSKKSCSRRPPSVTTRPQKSDKIKQDVSYPLLSLPLIQRLTTN